MEFMALDVETANADMSSICQIGIAAYESGSLATEWKTLIDPEDSFDGINVSIHGIDEKAVQGAPTFRDIHPLISGLICDRIVVCHTHFDHVAIQQALMKHKLPLLSCTWLDSARVARRAWEEFAWSGYGLKNVCDRLGYEFAHHDALEDAKAAAQILLAAITKTGLDLRGWLERVEQPISCSPSGHARFAQDGNPEGPLFGEVLVFTGTLTTPRREAAGMAARIGCAVADGINKKTTLLVVGDQDVSKLAGHEKSSKHRKAEELILKGQAIRIIRETDFRELVVTAQGHLASDNLLEEG